MLLHEPRHNGKGGIKEVESINTINTRCNYANRQ